QRHSLGRTPVGLRRTGRIVRVVGSAEQRQRQERREGSGESLHAATMAYRAGGRRHMRLSARVSSPLTMITSATVMHCRPSSSGSSRATTVDVPETSSRVFEVHDADTPISASSLL